MFLAFAPAFFGGLDAQHQETGRMAVDETGQDPNSSQDARLTSLEERLKRAEQAEAKRTGKDLTGRDVVRSAGARILSDLVGYPFGGAVVGWLLDRWLETTPWVMLALMFVGFGLAVRNVMRLSRTSK
jgi:ATP synthase protein I